MTRTGPSHHSGHTDHEPGHELTVERVISATPAAVFDGFLSLYGPDRPDWVLESDLDLRAGGTWTLVFQPPGVPRFRETRVFCEVERPSRLGYTVTITAGARPAFQTTVLLTFEGVGDRTRVRLTQSGFPDAAVRDDFAAAWPDVLGEVARRLTVSGYGQESPPGPSRVHAASVRRPARRPGPG